MLREGMVIADRYEVIEKIGSGGMSDVYKAKCRKLNRYVAIKVLKSEFSGDKTFVSKFRAEAQSAAGLMHANIVNVYDVGEENGIYYIVMELVEGITLKKYIEKKGRLGVREAVSIAIQVAQGMEAAHNHKIIHRDIKPQNIIISKEGKVKVTDFGIARAATSNTINSAVMGSVHYISPEQARGGYSDDKGDIYSFGIMFFEMLTGRVPFEGETTVAIALQHIQDDMDSPKKYVPEIPISVEKIVLKCTQKKTEKRYQSAMELISDLKRSLVTPDEDFVIIATAVTTDAPTQMIAPEEVAQINERAKQSRSAGLDYISPMGAASRPSRTVDPIEDDILADEDTDIDTDAEKAKKIDKIIAILGIAVGIVIIIITIVIIFKVADTFSGSNNTTRPQPTTTAPQGDGLVEVPLVVGYTYEQAKEVLSNLNLGIKEIYDYSDTYAANIIFHQSEENGKRVSPNTTITVTISKGAKTFELPNIIGQTQADAERVLKGKNLKVSYSYETTEDEAKWGKVKSSNPLVGSSVKSGDVITLVIYNSPEVVNKEVPDLSGYTASEARAKLNELGFKDVSLEYEYDDNVAKDLVIALSGAKVGEYADVTTPLTLVISKGVDPSKPTEGETETQPDEDTTTSKIEETLSYKTHIKPIVDETAAEADLNKDLMIVIRYKAKYTDADGKSVTEQIAATTYTNFAALEAAAESDPMLDKTLSGSVKAGTEAKILIELLYNVEKGDDGKITSSKSLGAKEVMTTTTK